MRFSSLWGSCIFESPLWGGNWWCEIWQGTLCDHGSERWLEVAKSFWVLMFGKFTPNWGVNTLSVFLESLRYSLISCVFLKTCFGFFINLGPAKEWLSLSCHYSCNLICHACRSHKDSFTAPSDLQSRFRHDTASFLAECVKGDELRRCSTYDGNCFSLMLCFPRNSFWVNGWMISMQSYIVYIIYILINKLLKVYIYIYIYIFTLLKVLHIEHPTKSR